LERTRARVAAAEVSVDAEIAELKELARLHVAGYIGEPAATNNLTTGRSTQLPAPAAGARPNFVVPAPSEPVDDAVTATAPSPVLNGKSSPERTR
jgi:hypothetical protein